MIDTFPGSPPTPPPPRPGALERLVQPGEIPSGMFAGSLLSTGRARMGIWPVAERANIWPEGR